MVPQGGEVLVRVKGVMRQRSQKSLRSTGDREAIRDGTERSRVSEGQCKVL